MGQVSEEIELDLGLSIGNRTFQESEKLNDCLNSDEYLKVVDPQRKREIQASRREEEKMKIEEKQHRKGSAVDEVLSMAVQKDDAFDSGERECKKIKVENSRSDNAEVKLSSQEEKTVNYASVVQMRYPYSQLQYVSFNNGFTIPWVMPCWSPSGAAVAGNDKNFFQPVACRSFRQFQGVNVSNECDASEQKSRKYRENGKLVSNPSVCSSSGICDNWSSFNEGKGSIENRSYSSHSTQEQCQNTDSTTNDTEGQSESAPCHHIESTQVTCEPSNTTSNLQSKSRRITETKSDPIKKPTSTCRNLKEAKKAIGKPPKPQIQNQNNSIVSDSKMPCVSTTGNGSNGKTVRGFLYRYTKAEVSIVCVCHGKSFSPAEFVEHAGGTDISNPLRHITVVPFG